MERLRKGIGKERSMLVLTICALLLVPSGRLLRWLIPGADTEAVPYALAVCLQELVLWLLPALLMRPWRLQRLGRKEHLTALALLACPMGACIQLSTAAARSFFASDAVSSGILLPRDALGWAATVAALVIVPAFCEEAFFRGCLAVDLQHASGTAAALALSPLFFAMLHGSPSALPSLLCLGVMDALLMLATGRVWVPMLCHLGYNAMALVMAVIDVPAVLGLAGLLPLCVFVWQLRRVTFTPFRRPAPGDLLLALLAASACLLRFL